MMTIRGYSSFDLLVTPTREDGYHARVLRSQAGQGQTNAFVLPFTQEELLLFFWLSGATYRKLGLKSGPSTKPLTPRQFGERLYAAVFAGSVGECFVRSLDEVYRTERGLRVCLRLNDVPELALMPWEFLYAPSPVSGFLALSNVTPIVRFPELGMRERALPVSPPLRLLAVVSNPKDLQGLNVELEYTQIQASLADLEKRNLLRLERLVPPTRHSLQSRLRDRTAGDVHILHFMGHGTFDESSQQGILDFEDEKGCDDPITAENLGILLNDHPALRLVFLNACEGAKGSRNDFFVGIAQTLMRQGTPAVVAMQFPIDDQAAIGLTQEFYRSLTQGIPLDACVTEGRKALKVSGDELAWGTPVLFSRAEDTRVLIVSKGGTHLAGEDHSELSGAVENRLFVPPLITIRGTERVELANALADAFDSRDRLRQMIKSEMGQNLELIAGGSDLRSVTFGLVDWAQREGYVSELVQGALNAMPSNQRLRSFVASLGADA